MPPCMQLIVDFRPIVTALTFHLESTSPPSRKVHEGGELRRHAHVMNSGIELKTLVLKRMRTSTGHVVLF